MLSIFSLFSSSKLSCKNPYDQDIDWTAVFKVPTIKDKIPTHVSGLGFFYMDSNVILGESSSDLGSTIANPIYNSMKLIYSNQTDKYGYMLISDQPAHTERNPSDSYAHKKGILVYDKDNAVYIEHSVPRFPNDPEKVNSYSFPLTGTTYGQAMLCVTLKKNDVEEWAKGMLIEKGYVYAKNIPSFTADFAPSLIKVADGMWDKTQTSKITNLQIGSNDFVLFSKAGKSWNKDLYHDLIAPTFKEDTFSETWARGVGTMTSNCTGKYKAHNVLDVNFQGVTWSRMNDHSKWAVSGDYFCIGGINRQNKQLERGGGTWCKHDAKIASIMKKVIINYEQCP